MSLPTSESLCSPQLFFKALAEPTRLKIILLLFKKTELCVCDFTQVFAMEQPRISRYLAELKGFDLIVGERRGKWVYYRLNINAGDWRYDVIQTTLAQQADFIKTELATLLSADNCC
ncbi:ArsR/SmtB family transcription factor [Algibacillus agarilyticus]|uniref:ArsR/SmtB family transcription factor n=1 Tax=Algibacillus agarilyticus TaxID=2234133 RepID=UPI000DD05862|nr:metalloregulator ArsR/SmtB family transcription factor [Algibacillus agarilyticus]